jgi:hypothetical protein
MAKLFTWVHDTRNPLIYISYDILQYGKCVLVFRIFSDDFFSHWSFNLGRSPRLKAITHFPYCSNHAEKSWLHYKKDTYAE